MGYMVNNQTGARYEFQDDMNGPRNRFSDLLTQYGASAANPIDYMGQKGYLTQGRCCGPGCQRKSLESHAWV